MSYAHRRLEEFGYQLPWDSVLVGAGEVAVVRLTLPSTTELLALACENELDERPDKSAVLLGRVTESTSGLGLDRAEVEIAWDEFRLGLNRNPSAPRISAGDVRASRRARDAGWSYRISTQGERIVATTDGVGFFRACVVPVNTRLSVVATWGPFRSRLDTLRVPEGVVAMSHDLAVPVASRGR